MHKLSPKTVHQRAIEVTTKRDKSEGRNYCTNRERAKIVIPFCDQLSEKELMESETQNIVRALLAGGQQRSVDKYNNFSSADPCGNSPASGCCRCCCCCLLGLPALTDPHCFFE